MAEAKDFQLLAQLIDSINGAAIDLDKAVSTRDDSAVKKAKDTIKFLHSQIKTSIIELKGK